MAYQMISILSFWGSPQAHPPMGYTMWLGQSQKKGEDHIAEKGKGTWCRKGKRKTRRRGRGRSRRNIWTKSPEQSIGPPGQAPRRGERSDHKVTAAFPLQGAAVT